jgi:MRG-binding protein
MIALSEHLRNHGYDPRVDKHTRIPGIWQKLKTLYNLDIIDDRENSFEYEEDAAERFLEFNLPEEDYEDDMWMRGKRRPSEAPSSPSRLSRSPSPQPTRKRKRGDTVTTRNRASTVDDTDEARTSPAHSPPPKTTRLGKNTNRSRGRGQPESSPRQPSKDTTADDDDAEEVVEEVVEEVAEEEAEEAEQEEGEEPEEEEEEGTPSPKATRAASKAKADAEAKAQAPSRKSKRKR